MIMSKIKLSKMKQHQCKIFSSKIVSEKENIDVSKIKWLFAIYQVLEKLNIVQK